MTDDIRSKVSDLMEPTISDLEALARIPSVAFPGYPPDPVYEAADKTVDVLTRAGLGDVRKLDIPDGYPAVFGELPAPAGAPTVLLYAHYDVQPSGPESSWESPPFEPTRRNGRLFGRGAVDDKAGIVMHAAAIKAFGADTPVGVKVIIEGEEETDSHLEAYVDAHPDLFQCDLVVVADTRNWRRGEPTLTTSLRGIASCLVEVATLRDPVHSGAYGGPAPDALIALIKLLSKLHDERGNVAIPGLASGSWDGLDQPEDDFREGAGVLPGVDLIGDGTVSDRLCAKPSVSVIGLDAPTVAASSNALVPRARALISLRLAPGDDPVSARRSLADHLEASAPWNVQVKVTEAQGAHGFRASVDGPGFKAARTAMERAYGKQVTQLGEGGSIPLINTLAAAVPNAEIVMWGVADENARVHSSNESVDLRELERGILSEAFLLEELVEAKRTL